MPPKTLDLRSENEMVVPDPPKGLRKRTRDVWAAFFRAEVARAIDLDSDLPRLVRWIKYDGDNEVGRS